MITVLDMANYAAKFVAAGVLVNSQHLHTCSTDMHAAARTRLESPKNTQDNSLDDSSRGAGTAAAPEVCTWLWVTQQ